MLNIDFTGNPNQRTPCVLVLDASGSMAENTSTGKTRIIELNTGIKAFESALRSDDTSIARVQLAIVSIGGPNNDAEVMMDWTDAINFEAFDLTTGGATPLGKGLCLALGLVEDAKSSLKANGISYTRPWIIVVSDGAPTDNTEQWNLAVKECLGAEKNKKVEIFSIGVEGADLNKLGQFSTKPPLMLSGMKFEELFVWLSSSLSAASRSRPGDSVQLPSTDPWRYVGL